MTPRGLRIKLVDPSSDGSVFSSSTQGEYFSGTLKKDQSIAVSLDTCFTLRDESLRIPLTQS